jgi:hypothetical protein
VNHKERHPLAGKSVRLSLKGSHPHITDPEPVLRLEDWWDRVGGGSWMDATGNPACLVYAMRGGVSGLPIDNDVVYGKVGPFGHLIHVSELGEVVA